MNKFAFDLQRFADEGTVVNATTHYANAYTGTTEQFSGNNTLTPEMKTYYDTELLENAKPQMVYTQFGRKQGLPKGRGTTVEWRKINKLPNAQKLTEGVIPTGEKLGVSYITDSVDQYGMYVAVSDRLELHAIDDLILEVTEELSNSMGSTKEELTRNDLMTGTSVIFCPKIGDGGTVTEVTSRAGLDATAKLTPTVVNQAATFLKTRKAPKVDGKNYVCIIHPHVAYDLRQSEEWIEAHKYAATEEIFNGEIGKLHGVRFVETSDAKIFAGGDNDPEGLAVYGCLFLGEKAYGIIDTEDGAAEMIIKDKNQSGGPLNQFSTIGYKMESNGAKILYEDRMVRVECCSSYSATDEAN